MSVFECKTFDFMLPMCHGDSVTIVVIPLPPTNLNFPSKQ